MNRKNSHLPRSPMNRRLKRSVEMLRKMTIPEKIQLMVDAELMTQAEADEAKRR